MESFHQDKNADLQRGWSKHAILKNRANLELTALCCTTLDQKFRPALLISKYQKRLPDTSSCECFTEHAIRNSIITIIGIIIIMNNILFYMTMAQAILYYIAWLSIQAS